MKAFFYKIPISSFFLHKSLVWWTLGNVMNIFSYCHFHNASKECSWQKKVFKFHARFQKCHFDNFSIHWWFAFAFVFNCLDYWVKVTKHTPLLYSSNTNLILLSVHSYYIITINSIIFKIGTLNSLHVSWAHFNFSSLSNWELLP